MRGAQLSNAPGPRPGLRPPSLLLPVCSPAPPGEQVCSPAPCAPGRGEPRRALGVTSAQTDWLGSLLHPFSSFAFFLFSLFWRLRRWRPGCTRAHVVIPTRGIISKMQRVADDEVFSTHPRDPVALSSRKERRVWARGLSRAAAGTGEVAADAGRTPLERGLWAPREGTRRRATAANAAHRKAACAHAAHAPLTP